MEFKEGSSGQATITKKKGGEDSEKRTVMYTTTLSQGPRGKNLDRTFRGKKPGFATWERKGKIITCAVHCVQTTQLLRTACSEDWGGNEPGKESRGDHKGREGKAHR